MRFSFVILCQSFVAVASLGCSTASPTPALDAGTADGAKPPTASTNGIGQPCPASGCATGQSCVTSTGPEGTTSTCQIKCTSNEECPSPTKCNLPPLVPDQIANICE